MNSLKNSILTINGGSSSIKFALYKIEKSLVQVFHGALENIGATNACLGFTNAITNQKSNISVKATNHVEAISVLIDWLEKQDDFICVNAIGHRIVHGMQHTEPERIIPALIDELKKISAFDPDHLPEEIKLIEVFRKQFPDMVQIACFDTSFHTTMPLVAQWLSIPRRYYGMGIRRYGFHGLSYSYLMDELNRTAGMEVAKGKIILAHLGSGASLAAIKDGKSMDTSMGFTPTSGLLMGTRTGDLDPGAAWYLMQNEKLSSEQFNHLINHVSGLLGISETSSDMKELLKNQAIDHRAAEAIELFCYQVRKWIGSFAAVLGGVDTLVFSGGIGENAPEIRSRICQDLQFLGIDLDERKNAINDEIISVGISKVSVRVIKTNEELMIAKLVCNFLNYSIIN